MAASVSMEADMPAPLGLIALVSSLALASPSPVDQAYEGRACTAVAERLTVAIHGAPGAGCARVWM